MPRSFDNQGDMRLIVARLLLSPAFHLIVLQVYGKAGGPYQSYRYLVHVMSRSFMHSLRYCSLKAAHYPAATSGFVRKIRGGNVDNCGCLSTVLSLLSSENLLRREWSGGSFPYGGRSSGHLNKPAAPVPAKHHLPGFARATPESLFGIEKVKEVGASPSHGHCLSLESLNSCEYVRASRSVAWTGLMQNIRTSSTRFRGQGSGMRAR